MPEISRFLGIIITMYYSEHPPPHFHVRYGEHKAVIAIEPPAILRGSLPPRVHGLVIEWAAMHRDDLLANWQAAKLEVPLQPIEPLE
jgi:hypothetical protein